MMAKSDTRHETLLDRYLVMMKDVKFDESLFGDSVIFWHNTDEVARPKEFGRAIWSQVRQHVPDFSVEVVRSASTAYGGVIEYIMSGTGPSGAPIRIPACIALSMDEISITRVDEYVDGPQAGALAEAMGIPS